MSEISTFSDAPAPSVRRAVALEPLMPIASPLWPVASTRFIGQRLGEHFLSLRKSTGWTSLPPETIAPTAFKAAVMSALALGSRTAVPRFWASSPIF